SLLFSQDDNNDPMVFDEPPTEVKDEDEEGTSGPSYNGNVSSSGGFAGIYRNEGANTEQQSTTSSALGRGQMVRGTRELMYKKLGITDVAAAEAKFKTDPKFEAQVNEAYRDDLDKRI